MDPVELFLVVIVWGCQIAATLLFALLLAGLGWTVEQAVRRKRPRVFPRFFIALALLCSLLAGLTVYPPVICPKELQSEFAPEFDLAVRSVSRGLYSSDLPLVPAFVKITDIQKTQAEGTVKCEVFFTIQYLYFGQVGMSYTTHDGHNSLYNIEKLLN